MSIKVHFAIYLRSFIWGSSLFTLPSISLIAFVLFSSYHFGEQYWEDRLSFPYFI